jgi:hypothetical protein
MEGLGNRVRRLQVVRNVHDVNARNLGLHPTGVSRSLSNRNLSDRRAVQPVNTTGSFLADQRAFRHTGTESAARPRPLGTFSFPDGTPQIRK